MSTEDYSAGRFRDRQVRANNPEGFAWAWRVLSPEQPLNEGSAYGTLNTKKIIVRMTDGQNELTPEPRTGANLNLNRSDYSSVGYAFKNRLGSTSPSAIGEVDSKVATVCNQRQAEGHHHLHGALRSERGLHVGR